MTISAYEVNELKKAPVSDGVLPAVLNRWSARAFSDRDVSADDLKRVFEAARWAASSRNEQPWRYFVGRRGSQTYQKIYSTLAPANQVWAGAAPVLIFGVASTKFVHNGSENRVALYDLGAATSYLTLQAAALGLTTHQMAGFDEKKALEVFAIPEGYEAGAVVALGYQGEPSALSNQHLLEMETSPRTRKPLKEFVLSAWGEAAELE